MLKHNNNIDLTEGNILHRLIVFALPILVGQLFQQLYNSVDSIVVGNFVGTDALAAVTASSTIANFLVGFFLGMATGASVLFSLSFGARDYTTLDEAIHTTLAFSAILGAVVAGLGILFTPQLLRMVSCPENVYADALVYLRIYLVGVLFLSMYNVAAAVLRSIGDAQAPFYYLVLASCMNIVLDVLLVTVIKIGVAGVAIATVISQFTSVVLSIRRMMRMDERYRFRVSKLRINWTLLKKIIDLGLPAGLQSSLTAFSNLYLQHYINSFSSAAIAGIGSAQKIDSFAGMPSQAMGLAMTTYIGQNLGAGKPERARKGTAVSVVMVAVMVAAVGIPSYLFSDTLMAVFGPDPEMIRYGSELLHVIMPVYFIMGLQMLFSGIIRGYGYSKTTMAMAVGGMVVLRQIWLAISLNIHHRIEYIYWGYPLGWIAAVIPMLLFYFIVCSKRNAPASVKTKPQTKTG